MQITIVAPLLGEENNGTSVATMNLINSLRAKGHKVNVVCGDAWRKDQEGFYVLPKLSLGPLDPIVAANNVSLAKFDKQIIKEACKGSDVVHVMFPLFLGAKVGKFVAKELHIPVTGGFHAQAENFTSHLFNFMHWDWLNRKVYKMYYKNLYQYCDAIHYPTKFIQNVFEEIVGPTNGYVVSNGVRRSYFKKEVERPEHLKNKKIILFTGRMSKEKSHSVLVKAVALSKYESDIQLVFAGQGPKKKQIEKLSKKLLTNQPLMKFFTFDELNDMINMADLYVHPAEIEIEAISCLEAIKCGKVPVIANSKGCATKAFALDERSLFKVNNARDLSDKIDYWFDHEDERLKMEKEYAKSPVVDSVEVCMDRMEDMFMEVIKDAKAKKSLLLQE